MSTTNINIILIIKLNDSIGNNLNTSKRRPESPSYHVSVTMTLMKTTRWSHL